jgi:hypothetical protein
MYEASSQIPKEKEIQNLFQKEDLGKNKKDAISITFYNK